MNRLKTAALACVGATVLTLPAQAADQVSLLLNWYVYGEHAPFYLGKEEGVFADEGIELEIQEGRGSALTVQAVAAGTVPFGYADVPTMIKAAAKGAPIVTIGVALQRNPMSVMGFTDKNIRTPEDIKGKTVAMTPGDSMSQIWPLFLQQTGLSESDFNVVSGDAQTKLNAVINGQADLLLGYAMDQSMKIKDATGKDVYPIMFADYGINMVSSGVLVNPDFLEENPDLAQRFMRAAARSVELAIADPKAAAAAVLKALPDAGKPETLQEGFERTIPLYHTEATEDRRPFDMTDEMMAETVRLLVDYGGVDSSANDDPAAFYRRDALPGGAAE
ncbi:ABC transporter substrate-binding protein [Marinivivus vitaminiproducens]|uniref:ABC transporter substrate-binding protein n=1 Tax=Marinivivus vitaminiproducens TaxID=3035935 RepID=UPI003F9F3692